MRRRNQLAWKMSVPVLAVVSIVILAVGLLGSLLSRKAALDAARNLLHFNSTSICSGIGELMVSDNHAGMIEFFDEISRRSTTYQDISLVSHPSGRVAFTQRYGLDSLLTKDNEICGQCHVNGGEPAADVVAHDEVIPGPNASRLLSVVTPIFNEPGCSTPDCHIHAEAGTVLGLLLAQYSLAGFDDLMSGLNLVLALAALVAIVLAVGTLLIMFRFQLAKPLRLLVAGIRTLAGGDPGFRFPARRNDEIGLVEESFNKMAAQTQAQQKELRRALDYQQGIVENTADLIIAVNPDGYIQTFNRGAEQALGYMRKEVLGRKVEMLFADPQERKTAIARLQEQDAVTNWETRFRTKDGKYRNVLITLSRLRDRRGNLIGTLGISKDVTTEKDLQKKLIRSEQEAAIGRAVTGIQHAIKNMLNTLKGGLYIVQSGQKKNAQEQISEGCEMLEEGLTHINDLSHNMLKYAREWKVETEPVDLGEMADKILGAVSHTAQERSVTVRTEVDDSMPRTQCDPRLIHMGLMDIVSNALDACDEKQYVGGEKPEIVIRLRRAADSGNGSTVIEIQDNGIGMSREVKENVFTPFFSTKEKWGTGLGMALTSRIIMLHDGKIDVESEPEKGALFRITLPMSGPR